MSMCFTKFTEAPAMKGRGFRNNNHLARVGIVIALETPSRWSAANSMQECAMESRRYSLAVLLLSVLLVVNARLAPAAPISGTMDLTGSGALNALTIDWAPSGTGFGSVAIAAATGYFAGLPGSTATQRDMTRDPGAAGAAPAPAFAPAGGPIFLPDFLAAFTAPAYAGLFFDLTFIPVSVAAICTGAEVVGDSCRPDVFSPFTLEVLENQTVARFETRGFFEDSADPTSRSLATGLYTAIIDLPVGNILSVILSGGSVIFSYEATYSSANAAPEPPTIVLVLLGGLLLAGAVARHSRRDGDLDRRARRGASPDEGPIGVGSASPRLTCRTRNP
jgi:hypothetical protein